MKLYPAFYFTSVYYHYNSVAHCSDSLARLQRTLALADAKARQSCYTMPSKPDVNVELADDQKSPCC